MIISIELFIYLFYSQNYWITIKSTVLLVWFVRLMWWHHAKLCNLTAISICHIRTRTSALRVCPCYLYGTLASARQNVWDCANIALNMRVLPHSQVHNFPSHRASQTKIYTNRTNFKWSSVATVWNGTIYEEGMRKSKTIPYIWRWYFSMLWDIY